MQIDVEAGVFSTIERLENRKAGKVWSGRESIMNRCFQLGG